jgi:hypothetical protein
MDVMYLAVALLFFALSAGMVTALKRLMEE